MRHRWLLTLTCPTVLCAPSSPTGAFHTVFDYRVDRFDLDGNTFGPADGKPDFVDDFNDESSWFTAYGTASVIGGRLHVKSPGQRFPGPDGALLDLTEVQGDDPVASPH